MKKILFLIILNYPIYLLGATHLVTNTNDKGLGSLRQAIIDANADSTMPRIINFSIDVGMKIIKPLTSLPDLTASHIVIDGSSQPGWTAGHPVIVIDGFIADFRFDGITINGANNCIIQDVVINHGFIRGISIINSAQDNTIYDCFIGTDYIGTHTSANVIGIMLSAFGLDQNNNTIIGAPDKGNLISGNRYMGILLVGNVNNTFIQGNKIGTDVTGQSALGDMKAGIAIGKIPMDTTSSCIGTYIGGSLLQEGNIISGNKVGIAIGFQTVSDLTIEENILGYNITGTQPIPNTKNMLIIQSVIPSIANLIIQNNIS